MKIHVNLSADDDLVKEAKERGGVLSEIFRDALLKVLRKPNIIEEPEITAYQCSWCKKMIIDDFYYYCIFHKNLFCDMCAHNKYEKVWDIGKKGNAPQCVNNTPHIDCICEKREIKVQYAEEIK